MRPGTYPPLSIREIFKLKLVIHFDGGSRGNPGPASAGVVITDADTGKPVHEAGYFLGKHTNNVAEYQGLLRSLEQAQKLGGTTLEIYSDSELLVRQVNREYRVKSPDLKPLYEKAVKLLGGFKSWKVTHVRRDKNARADELANLAMDHKADVTGDTPRAESSQPQASPLKPQASNLAWSAKLSGRNGKCLAGCSTNNEYTFGPTTPEGFCVHATAAMLADGPLQWDKKKITGKTRCAACGLDIQMHVIHLG
jgi:ribonuclease HI